MSQREEGDQRWDAMVELRRERDRTAERALRSFKRLRESLDMAEEEIGKATRGEPARKMWGIPEAAYLKESVEYSAAFWALWDAAGIVDEVGS